jgi:restriction system protein
MIPDYQSLMLPLLRHVEDGKEHRIGEVIEPLGKSLGLSEGEMADMLPSGRQTTFANRVHWAKTYMAQAKLLELTRRAYFRITDRGREVLRDNPSRIDVKLLERYPEFNEFRQRSHASEETSGRSELAVAAAEPEATATPDEILRRTTYDLDAATSTELLARILAASPAFFESLVVTLLLRIGYGGSREDAGRAIGKTGDGGVDGVIDQDPLGLDRVYVQAKRYHPGNSVQRTDISAFCGDLGLKKANKGVFVTTSEFTKGAREVAEAHQLNVVLIDGKRLTELMLRHNVGVRVAETLHIKKVDEDFFDEE